MSSLVQILQTSRILQNDLIKNRSTKEKWKGRMSLPSGAPTKSCRSEDKSLSHQTRWTDVPADNFFRLLS